MQPQSQQPEAAAGDSHHHFINRALSFTLLENLFKPISPLLELVCAGLFVGGVWGRYKFYESLVFLLFRISLMGIDKSIIWYFAQVDEKAYLKTFFRALSFCFAACAGIGLFTWASYAGWLPLSGWVLGRNAESFRVPAGEFIPYLMAVPMMVAAELCIQANVNMRNLKYRILAPGIVVPLVIFGSAIAGRFVAPETFTLSRCFLLGWTAGAILAFIGFWRAHRPSLRDISLVPALPWRMIRYSFPLASANVLSALAVRADIFMLAGMAGLHSVEVYTVVSMIGKSLTSVRQSFENILLSAFSSSASGKLTLKLRHYFNYSIWMVMSIEVGLLAVIVLFGAQGLGWINGQYAAGYWALVLTAFFVYINTLADFSGLLALGLGRTHIVPLVHVIFFGVNLGLNFLWIPRWDTVGAALALGVANSVGGAIYLAYLGIRYRSPLVLREYWLSIAGAGLLFGVPALLAVRAETGLAAKTALVCVCGGVVFWLQKGAYARFNERIRALT